MFHHPRPIPIHTVTLPFFSLHSPKWMTTYSQISSGAVAFPNPLINFSVLRMYCWCYRETVNLWMILTRTGLSRILIRLEVRKGTRGSATCWSFSTHWSQKYRSLIHVCTNPSFPSPNPKKIAPSGHRLKLPTLLYCFWPTFLTVMLRFQALHLEFVGNTHI